MVTLSLSSLAIWPPLLLQVLFETVSSVPKYKDICKFNLTASTRACCKECRLLLWEDVNAQPVPRPAFPGPRGILATGTTQAEAVTPTVDSLGIV